MLTKEDLEQIAGLIKASEERLEKSIKTVDRKVETVDMKVEANHEFNKKAHTEIVDLLVESGETNYHELKKELKELKKRIEQLETKQQN
jgi:hypothetical protein